MQAKAILKGYPTSPRKMRLVVDLIRGKNVVEARKILKFSTKHSSTPVFKTLNSAVSNFMKQNERADVTEENLIVSEAFVNQGVTLKRISPAPMGRAHRIRKRSNHLTIIVSPKQPIKN